MGPCQMHNNCLTSLILVYEYLPRGILEEILHSRKEHKDTFGWNEREKVELGISQCIELSAISGRIGFWVWFPYHGIALGEAVPAWVWFLHHYDDPKNNGS